MVLVKMLLILRLVICLCGLFVMWCCLILFLRVCLIFCCWSWILVLIKLLDFFSRIGLILGLLEFEGFFCDSMFKLGRLVVMYIDGICWFVWNEGRLLISGWFLFIVVLDDELVVEVVEEEVGVVDFEFVVWVIFLSCGGLMCGWVLLRILLWNLSSFLYCCILCNVLGDSDVINNVFLFVIFFCIFFFFVDMVVFIEFCVMMMVVL